MKTLSLPLAAILSGALLLTACADSGDATEKTTDQMQDNREEMNEAKGESAEEWREARTEAIKELRDLREKFEKRKMNEQERLNDGIENADKKAETQAMIAELETNIKRIDASIAKMDLSTGTDWNNVQQEARRTADDTKNWWDRQKDNVDSNTDADRDNDGK